MARPTTTMEDYLETIYRLIKDKGYARVSDIAEALTLQPSSVTRMVQRLDEQNYVIYERYRGLALTPEGERVGKQIWRRHQTLEKFLRLIGVEDEETIQEDVEGIEHHVSVTTLEAISQMVEFLETHPDLLTAFEAHFHKKHQAGTGDQ